MSPNAVGAAPRRPSNDALVQAFDEVCPGVGQPTRVPQFRPDLAQLVRHVVYSRAREIEVAETIRVEDALQKAKSLFIENHIDARAVAGYFIDWLRRQADIHAAEFPAAADQFRLTAEVIERLATLATPAQAPAAVTGRGEEAVPCEGDAGPDCGPAVHTDDGGTMLCQRCYDALEPESPTQRRAREAGLSVVDPVAGVPATVEVRDGR